MKRKQRFSVSTGTGAAANCLCVLPRTQLSQWTHTKSPSVLLLFALLGDCVCACVFVCPRFPLVICLFHSIFCKLSLLCHGQSVVLSAYEEAVKLGVMLPSGATTTAAWANCQSPVIGLAKCLTPLYNCSSVSSTWPTRCFASFIVLFIFLLPGKQKRDNKNDKLTALIGHYVLLQFSIILAITVTLFSLH